MFSDLSLLKTIILQKTFSAAVLSVLLKRLMIILMSQLNMEPKIIRFIRIVRVIKVIRVVTSQVTKTKNKTCNKILQQQQQQQQQQERKKKG
jgi:hypothetical protein